MNQLSAAALEKTLCELLAIRSLSGEEAPLAAHLQQRLQHTALPLTRDADDNLWVVLEPREAPAEPARVTLHLSGHTDTVVPVAGWSADPWTPRIGGLGLERRVTGLGASDMKAGLAVMVHLAELLALPAERLRRLRVVVSFTVCEEMPAHGKRNGVHALLKREPGRWAVTTEASCDPKQPYLTVGCQAHAVATVTLRGLAAHSACPEAGLNAIHAAAELARRVEHLHAQYPEFTVAEGAVARAAVSVTRISGGSAANIIPERCEVTLSRRLAPGETAAHVETELAVLTRELNGVKAEWTLRCDGIPCVTDTAGPLYRAAHEASTALFGSARPVWNRARTDMVLFAQAGMDVLNIGPGYFGQAHVADEYARSIDLERSAKLLLETLRRLDRTL
jgi:succinyl-diaminopimelate desuccinylase